MRPDLETICQGEWGGARADADGVTVRLREQDSLVGYCGLMKWGTRKMVRRKGRRIDLSAEAVDRAEPAEDDETPPTRNSSPFQDPVSPSVVETPPISHR